MIKSYGVSLNQLRECLIALEKAKEKIYDIPEYIAVKGTHQPYLDGQDEYYYDYADNMIDLIIEKIKELLRKRENE